MRKTDEIKQTLASIASNQSLLDYLIEFENTIDNAGVYGYKNWFSGELVEGPELSRYWFTTTWMFPYKKMPDPRGGLRLLKAGCKIYYKKDIYIEPNRITGPISVENSKTKKAKHNEYPIWLVTIKMPRRFIDDGLESYVEVEDEDELQEVMPEPSNADVMQAPPMPNEQGAQSPIGSVDGTGQVPPQTGAMNAPPVV